MKLKDISKVKFTVGLITSFILAFVLADNFGSISEWVRSIDDKKEFAKLYDTNSDTTSNQLLMVYIGCSSCGFSNDPNLVEDIKSISNHVLQEANRS